MPVPIAILTTRSLKDIAQFDQAYFKERIIFYSTIYSKNVSFEGTTFANGASFDKVIFEQEVTFDNAFMKGKFSAEFLNVTFKQSALFRSMTLTHAYLHFSSCIFTDDALFSQLHGNNGGELAFHGCTFRGRAYFIGVHLNFLGISTYGQDEDGKWRRISEPTMFEKAAQFEQMECDIGEFYEAEFRDDVDFGESRFKRFADFDHVLFGGAVKFLGRSDEPIFPDLNDAPADVRFPLG